jgi:fructose-1,6-bisphosphatase/inositol monophosphatase family enzyme
MKTFWAFLSGLVEAIMTSLVYYAGREQGRRVEKIEQNEKVHENLTKAKDSAHRLDDDKRQRLRERYKYK